MTREIVLDANVLVAWLDSADVLAPRAAELLSRLREQGAELVLLDFLVGEAVSVLCRRATQRKSARPDLGRALEVVRGWAERGRVRTTALEDGTIAAVIGVVASTGGALNFNDALVALLQQRGAIGAVASFDAGFDVLEGFERVS